MQQMACAVRLRRVEFAVSRPVAFMSWSDLGMVPFNFEYRHMGVNTLLVPDKPPPLGTCRRLILGGSRHSPTVRGVWWRPQEKGGGSGGRLPTKRGGI